MRDEGHQRGDAGIGDTHEVRSAVDEAQTVSGSVIQTVAAAKQVDPIDLEPLEQFVDTDALNTIWKQSAEDTIPMQIIFSYQGFEVTVIDGETVVLQPARQIPADD